MFQYNNRGYAHSLSSPLSVVDIPQDTGVTGLNFQISDDALLATLQSHSSTYDPFNTSMSKNSGQSIYVPIRQDPSSLFPTRPKQFSDADYCSTSFNGLEQQTTGHDERGGHYTVTESNRRPWWAAGGSGVEAPGVAERVQRLSVDAASVGLDELQNRRPPASLPRLTHHSTVAPSNHWQTDLTSTVSERLTQSAEGCAAPMALNCPTTSAAFEHLPSSSVTRHSSTAPIHRPRSRAEPTLQSTSEVSASKHMQFEQRKRQIDDEVISEDTWLPGTPSTSGPGDHQKLDQRHRPPSKSSVGPLSRYCDHVSLSPSAKPLLHSMNEDGDVIDTDSNAVNARPQLVVGGHVGSPTCRSVDVSSATTVFADNRVRDGGGTHVGLCTTPSGAPLLTPRPPSTKHAENVVCSTIRLPPRMTAVSNDGHLSLLADTPHRRSTMSRPTPRISANDDCPMSTDQQVTSPMTSSSGNVSKHPVVSGTATSRTTSAGQFGATDRHRQSGGSVSAKTRSFTRDETRCARRSCSSSSAETVDVDDSDVRGSLVTTAFLAGVSLFLGALAVQLLLRLTSMTSSPLASSSSSIFSLSGDREERSIRAVIEDVAVGLAVIVVAVDLCCLLTASLQCYFVIQLTRLSNGRDRARVFIHRCRVTRVLLAAGFLLSIPIFLLALLLHAVLEYEFTPAIICITVYMAGVVCIMAVAAHSIHCWRQSTLALDRRPTAREVPHGSTHEAHNINKAVKLSTLV